MLLVAAVLSVSVAMTTPPASSPQAPASAPVAARAPEAAARWFLSPLRSTVLDPASRDALESGLLVAARARRLPVVGADDLRGLLDLEATRQAAGCDSDSCAAELADALGAGEIVSAQVGRLGDVWTLSLTRLSRGDLAVKARVQVTRRGDSPSVLLDALDDAVAGIAPTAGAAQATVGAGLPTLGVGAGLAVVGVVACGVGTGLYLVAEQQLKKGAFDDARRSVQVGEPVWWAGVVVAAVGGVTTLVGAGLWWGEER